MINRDLLDKPFERVLESYPYARDFFLSSSMPEITGNRSISQFLSELDREPPDEPGVDFDPAVIEDSFLSFIEHMESVSRKSISAIKHVTITGGRDKSGRPELPVLELHAGEVVAVVGPTGSGKSMLLSDVEYLAQGDTPSGRRILIDGRVPDGEERVSGEKRLVAQLSQNMNFVMDLAVRDFLTLHAESRLVEDVDAVVGRIYRMASELAGEPFEEDTPVTALSGGQSRALMIADVACLSASPVVLIDEIENAGVDRREALNLLIRKEKIVLMATHDPVIAISCSRRVVIKNGGISAILETDKEEQALLEELNAMDKRLSDLRNLIRSGSRVH